eukprot:COSAG01_NODE_4_length_55812_cov_1344.168109_18_plen_498_part_00
MSKLEEKVALTEQQEYTQRVSKLEKLVSEGKTAFAFKYDRTHRNTSFVDAFDHLTDEALLAESTQKIRIAGRLISKRGHGKAFFGHVLDESVSLQIYSNLDLLGQELSVLQRLDIGDWVGIEGTPFRTKRGELSVKVHDFTLLSKALLPLPEKYHGLQDKELRYRYRYLDLATNMDVRAIFKKRSAIISFIRSFLEKREFMEVETPVLQPIYGGAAARPFVTHHNELKQDLYLRIALELYLKRLVVGGFERVFEIGRVFRNEGISYKHNPEYTLLELYQAYVDYEAMMQLTEDLFREAVQACCGSLQISYQGQDLDFSKPFRRLRMVDAIQEYVGVDVNDEDALRQKAKALRLDVPDGASKGQLISELYDSCVESKLIQPTFVIDYPWETSPLAKRRADDPSFVERFECIICGMELANAFSELTDPLDQQARFEDQMKAKEAGWEDAHEMDEDFIQALKHGMPPTGGLGIGVDRFVMLLCDARSIRDILFFPHMRQK